MSAPRPVLGVGVLGAGTVGSQVIRILQSSREDFAARSGAEMEVRRVLVRNVDAPRDSPIDRELLTTDPAEAIDGMDLVVELIGGIEPARTFVLRALTQGISVVTGNKALLAAHGPGSQDPIDVIHVGSPNSLHAQHAIAALEAGFHVVVEKPFALTRSQAEAMVEAARAADRFLMEAWLSAFEPGVAQVREALGRLDRLHRVVLSKEQFSSRMEAYRAGSLPPAFDPALGGGSLMDLGIYPVSLAIHLFGEPDRVTATGALLECGVDARGTVVLSYDCGEHAGLEVVCLHSKTSPGMESSFAGDHDVLSIDDCQWPERIEPLLPPQAVRVHITEQADGARELTISD